MFGSNRVNTNPPNRNTQSSPQPPPGKQPSQDQGWSSKDAKDTTQRSTSAVPPNQVLPQDDSPSPHFDFGDWHHGAGGSAAADGGGNNQLPPAHSSSSNSNGGGLSGGNAGGMQGSGSSGGSTSASQNSGGASSSGSTGSGGSAGVGQGTTNWAPMGDGPYTVNMKNSTNAPQTITLTGNGQQPVSKTLAPGQTMALTLPAGYSGNVMSSGPNDPPGKGTLFEVTLGKGQGSQSWFDVSNIVGHNVSMVADGGATGSGVGDSESTDLNHYVGPVDDSSTGANPMKSTVGTTLNLNIGSEALNTTSQPTALGNDATFAARSAAMGIAS